MLQRLVARRLAAPVHSSERMRSLLSEEEMARRQVVLAAFACLCAASVGHCFVQPVVVSTSANVKLDYRSGKAVEVEDLVAALPSEQSHVYCAVFIDELQLQDFSLFGDAYEGASSGGVFRNVKSLMETSRSSGVAPSVLSSSDSTSLSETLESRLAGLHAGLSVQTVDAHSVDDLATLEHAEGSASLWIVRILSSSEGMDRRAYLERSDALIGTLRQQLPSTYTILLTSSLPSSAETETVERSPARHLLASEVVSATDTSQAIERTIFAFYCADDQTGTNASVPADVLLSFDNITLKMENNVTLSMATDGYPVPALVGCVRGSLQNQTMAVASVTMSGASYTAKVDFAFYRTNGHVMNSSSSNSSFYWELRLIKVVMNDTEGAFTDTIGQCYVPPTVDDWIIAPMNFSFSCQPPREWLAVRNQSQAWRTVRDPGAFSDTGCANVTNGVMNFTISGLQVQAFSVEAHAKHPIFFGAPIDCVGYFSGPTWMGIIVSLFLISVLFGTSIIFVAMETPDRFDDPKGKNIQIGQ